MTNLRDFCEPGDTYRDFTRGGGAEIIPARHDTDGQVYLAYFRKDANLGFVWDGNVEHPIQVTHEMGEAVIDTFELNLHGAITINPPGLFLLFQRDCDHYTDTHEGDNA